MEVNMSNFVVFILAHGRPNITNTYDLLKDCGYTGKIVFLVDNEDKQVDGYYKRYGNDNVFMFDKIAASKECDSMNNFGSRRATLFARNKAFDVAHVLGYKYFLVLDDDYYYFGHRGEYGAKKTTHLDLVFQYFVDFLANTPCKAIAFSQGGDHIGGYHGDEVPMKRKCMNSWFCVTDRPFKFYGIMNDDVNAYLRGGFIGDIFFTYMPFQSTRPNRYTTSRWRYDGSLCRSRHICEIILQRNDEPRCCKDKANGAKISSSAPCNCMEKCSAMHY